MLGVLALLGHTAWRKASLSSGINQLGEPLCFQSSAANGIFLSHCDARVAQLRSLDGKSPNKMYVGAGKEHDCSCISGDQEAWVASRWCMG